MSRLMTPRIMAKKPCNLVLCALLLVLATQRVESEKCIVGCKKCDKETPKVCLKCKKGYELTASGGCNCAPGYGSTVDGSVPEPPKSFPTWCEPPPPGEKKPKHMCKCRKCKESKNPDKNMYGAGGPVELAQCTAPPVEPTLPTAPLRMPASYQINQSSYTGQDRWWVRAQFGNPPQPVNLIFDSGSFSVHTCGFNAAASSTAVSQNYSTVLIYGSGPVNITDFYADAVRVPGYETTGAGAATTLTNPSWRWIGSTGYNASCVPTTTLTYGGLVGAGPGGMQGLAAGATCTAPQGGPAPCATEVPPMFQALLLANSLPPMYTIDLPPPSTDAAANIDRGNVYLGGAPPDLPDTATLVSTPLQPNRWRDDVANGTNAYAWWQFNPLSMDVEYFDGSTTNLCNSSGLIGGITNISACTVIADTGYSWVPVKNATSLNTLVDATVAGSKKCAVRLWVKLPTNLEATTSQSIAIPLSSGTEGAACGDVINQNSFAWDSSTNTVFGAPGSGANGVAQYLTPNWFTFGQPILQLFRITFDTTAFNGNGGLHFIVNPNGTAAR